MKRISILCAAVLAAGTYTPAMAIGTTDPGYYNKCAAAYVSDPATYDRDCAASMNSLMGITVGAPPVVAPPAPTPTPSPGCGSINMRLLPAGERVKVAVNCNNDHCVSIDTRNFPIWARVKVATICPQ